MSYKFKTLVAYDTNSLRNLEAGDLAYKTFSFGKAFKDTQAFIIASGLEQYVSVAISELVIEELKIQKARKYKEDIEELKSIATRLAGMPHVPEGSIVIPDIQFNCHTYVEEEAQKFIQSLSTQIIKIKDEDSSSILRSMIAKVVQEKAKAPFKPPLGKDNKIKDAGFKDNVIWESLMHYEFVKDFDKVIFVTEDNGFDGCQAEFIDKWNKHFKIVKNSSELRIELTADYGNYIEFQKVYELSTKDVFTEHLKKQLNDATFLQLDNEDHKIENYHINNYCSKVETVLAEGGENVSPIINSSISIFITKENQKVELSVIAKTLLSDFETMEIEPTSFDPPIY